LKFYYAVLGIGKRRRKRLQPMPERLQGISAVSFRCFASLFSYANINVLQPTDVVVFVQK